MRLSSLFFIMIACALFISSVASAQTAVVNQSAVVLEEGVSLFYGVGAAEAGVEAEESTSSATLSDGTYNYDPQTEVHSCFPPAKDCYAKPVKTKRKNALGTYTADEWGNWDCSGAKKNCYVIISKHF